MFLGIRQTDWLTSDSFDKTSRLSNGASNRRLHTVTGEEEYTNVPISSSGACLRFVVSRRGFIFLVLITICQAKYARNLTVSSSVNTHHYRQVVEKIRRFYRAESWPGSIRNKIEAAFTKSGRLAAVRALALTWDIESRPRDSGEPREIEI